MNGKDILVYGAGPLGSLFAARLHEVGHNVSLLARGQRLKDLREYGIVLLDARTNELTKTHVNVVESLDPDDAYDLVLVVMRKNKALDILPILESNRHTPNILFLMNNAAGPDDLVKSLGKERVMIGFPRSAGYFEGHTIHVLAGTTNHEFAIPLGEVDGSITEKTRAVAEIINTASGYRADIRTDMNTWLKYHVALLLTSLAPALYAAGTDKQRLANTRDAVVLAVRAMREGFRALKALGFRISPRGLIFIRWLPEPVLIYFLKRIIVKEEMETAMVGHANAAREEMQFHADEFLSLVSRSSVPTPSIDLLYPHLDLETALIPEGSKEIHLNWGGVWIIILILFFALIAILKTLN